MSSFVGNGALTPNIHAATDYRHASEFYFGNSDLFLKVLHDPTWLDDAGTMGWAGAWWPRGNAIIGGEGGGLDTCDFLSKPPEWGDMWIKSGANGRFAWVGITRDQYGSPLGGCTVRMYRTSTEEQVCKVTSDPNTGLYYATSPYNDAHFIVVHNPAGTLGGATSTTLLPA